MAIQYIIFRILTIEYGKVVIQKLVQLEKRKKLIEESEQLASIIALKTKMKQQENEEHSISALPVIPRLDRIDRLLQFLEEKHHCSGRKRYSSNSAIKESLPEDQEFKTLSSAMEEVHHKGTLMERVAMLENRVLQLTMEMDEGNASGSSSSTIQDPVQTINNTKQEEASADACVTKPGDSHKRRRRRQKTIANITRRPKWLGWFQMGC